MAMRAGRYRIGYALLPKKRHSLIQPSLLRLASSHHIDLIEIDPSALLTEQGPFDCIFHKLYGSDWTSNLQSFSSAHPNVPIIDSPDAIQRINDRTSMLEVVARISIGDRSETVDAPKQIVLNMEKSRGFDLGAELSFPVMAKPVVANGGDEAHRLFLIFASHGLHNLNATLELNSYSPMNTSASRDFHGGTEEQKSSLVLQEFVNHGGVVFKVYVAGNQVKCVKRKSLPDVTEEQSGSLMGFLPFSRISNSPMAANNERNDHDMVDELDRVKIPPLDFIMEVADSLRTQLQLNLFNFDLIKDRRYKNRFLIVDINYLPGYAKVSEYESMLVSFFVDVLHKAQGGAADLEDEQ